MWQPDRAPQILPCKRQRSIGLGVPRIIFILVEKYLLVAIFHLAQQYYLEGPRVAARQIVFGCDERNHISDELRS